MNKAQLKIQQMAFMLMAVFIFFVLAGLFYIVIESTSLKKQATLLEKNNAIELARMLASSAEFSCGDYCIDGDRAMVLNKRTAYKNLWAAASIEIRTISASNEVLCTELNYPNCTLIKIYDKGVSGSTASSFVSLCKRNKEGDYISYKCELAKLIVGYEIK